MKKILAAAVLSAACAASAWATPVAYGGHYYDVIVDNGVSWDQARLDALNSYYLGLEGHLVTITSAGEDTAVGNLVASLTGGEVWTGGYQNPITETDPKAGWTWVNGEGSFPGDNNGPAYANWNQGEPNDAYGSASEQYLGLNLGTSGGFNDEGNLGLITGYVIEYDPTTVYDVPEATSTLGLLSAALATGGMVARRFRK
jgi:hypothetical protein